MTIWYHTLVQKYKCLLLQKSQLINQVPSCMLLLLGIVGKVGPKVLQCLIPMRRDKGCPQFRAWNYRDTNVL